LKSLKLYGEQDIRFEEEEKPTLNHDNDVIIKIHAVGICGSDTSRYAKLGPYVEGMVFGHEMSGEIVEIGTSVNNVKVGDRVAGVPSLVCSDLEGVEDCYYCKKSEYARCENLTVIGARHPGAYAQYVRLPAKNCVPIPDNVDYESASMVEPISVVLHGFYKTSITAGDTVVIVGCGNIGLIAIQVARVSGATNIIAVDIDDAALNEATDIGATHTINSMKENTLEKIEQITDGKLADLTVEAAGSKITSAQVFAYSGKGGEVLFLGIPYADINIERFYFERIVRNELTVLGSWNSVSAPFPGKEYTTALDLLSSGKLNVSSMITHRLKLEDGPDVFEELVNPESNTTFGKVIFEPDRLN